LISSPGSGRCRIHTLRYRQHRFGPPLHRDTLRTPRLPRHYLSHGLFATTARLPHGHAFHLPHALDTSTRHAFCAHDTTSVWISTPDVWLLAYMHRCRHPALRLRRRRGSTAHADTPSSGLRLRAHRYAVPRRTPGLQHLVHCCAHLPRLLPAGLYCTLVYAAFFSRCATLTCRLPACYLFWVPPPALGLPPHRTTATRLRTHHRLLGFTGSLPHFLAVWFFSGCPRMHTVYALRAYRTHIRFLLHATPFLVAASLARLPYLTPVARTALPFAWTLLFALSGTALPLHTSAFCTASHCGYPLPLTAATPGSHMPDATPYTPRKVSPTPCVYYHQHTAHCRTVCLWTFYGFLYVSPLPPVWLQVLRLPRAASRLRSRSLPAAPYHYRVCYTKFYLAAVRFLHAASHQHRAPVAHSYTR